MDPLQKTMLSLSKLAALASDERDEHIATAVEGLEHEWNVVAAQEQLPQCVLEEYGFDAENMRVLTPRYVYVWTSITTSPHISLHQKFKLGPS